MRQQINELVNGYTFKKKVCLRHSKKKKWQTFQLQRKPNSNMRNHVNQTSCSFCFKPQDKMNILQTAFLIILINTLLHAVNTCIQYSNGLEPEIFTGVQASEHVKTTLSGGLK